MSKGRVVAIYHKETREVLGYIPHAVITKQTGGHYDKFAISYRNPPYTPGPLTTQVNYDVVHDKNGNPIKVIANDKREADMLIASQKPSGGRLIAALLNEPNQMLEGLKV